MTRRSSRIEAEGRMWAVAVSLLLAMASSSCRDRSTVDLPEQITIAVATLPHASLIQLAVAKGFFGREGLSVTLQPHDFGKPALAALLAGKADLATCADTPVVFAKLHGERISVLATIASSTRITGLVAARAAGIDGPHDLAGKRVGLVRGTSAEFFLDTFLSRHGVETGAVRVVEMTPEHMLDALENGEVDAVAVWNPWIVALQTRLGDKVRTFYAEDVFFETFNLVGRPSFLQEHPAAVRKALRALVEAEAFFREQPEEARRTLLPASSPKLVEFDATVALFDFRVRLDQSLLVLLEEEARWAIRTGLVAKQDTPNFLDTIAADPLLAVKADAVELVR